MPPDPPAAWALWAQVTRPKGVYIRVTPVTTKATAVQTSTENPVLKTSALKLFVMTNLPYQLN